MPPPLSPPIADKVKLDGDEREDVEEERSSGAGGGIRLDLGDALSAWAEYSGVVVIIVIAGFWEEVEMSGIVDGPLKNDNTFGGALAGTWDADCASYS